MMCQCGYHNKFNETDVCGYCGEEIEIGDISNYFRDYNLCSYVDRGYEIDVFVESNDSLTRDLKTNGIIFTRYIDIRNMEHHVINRDQFKRIRLSMK